MFKGNSKDTRASDINSLRETTDLFWRFEKERETILFHISLSDRLNLWILMQIWILKLQYFTKSLKKL